MVERLPCARRQGICPDRSRPGGASFPLLAVAWIATALPAGNKYARSLRGRRRAFGKRKARGVSRWGGFDRGPNGAPRPGRGVARKTVRLALRSTGLPLALEARNVRLVLQGHADLIETV